MSAQETESYAIDCNLRDHYASYSFPKSFSCGESALDNYYKNNLRRALKSENVTGIGAISEQGVVFAFCTLTFLVLDRARVHRYLEPSNLPSQIPAVKLSMLAVDVNHQKRGIGGELLMLALEQAVTVHKTIPVKGMFLDASPKALTFYRSLGFQDLGEVNADGTLPMFMPIQVMVAGVAAAKIP